MLLVRAALLQVWAHYNCHKTDCFNVREITKALIYTAIRLAYLLLAPRQ
jgi:hypothetical protein